MIDISVSKIRHEGVQNVTVAPLSETASRTENNKYIKYSSSRDNPNKITAFYFEN
jgi:hypothetical protein